MRVKSAKMGNCLSHRVSASDPNLSQANKLEQQRVLESEEEELVALEQRSIGTSEGSQEVENFWAEQVRTLEREK